LSDPWFAKSVRDVLWVTNPAMGDACVFEDERPAAKWAPGVRSNL
jgi:hypothetical protein